MSLDLQSERQAGPCITGVALPERLWMSQRTGDSRCSCDEQLL